MLRSKILSEPSKKIKSTKSILSSDDFFKKFFDTAIQVSISESERKYKNTIKYVNIDTTINNNKLCKDVTKHLPINKNTKDPHKRRYLTQAQKQIYKNRIKIEHFFGVIKRYPEINCVYERTFGN